MVWSTVGKCLRGITLAFRFECNQRVFETWVFLLYMCSLGWVVSLPRLPQWAELADEECAQKKKSTSSAFCCSFRYWWLHRSFSFSPTLFPAWSCKEVSFPSLCCHSPRNVWHDVFDHCGFTVLTSGFFGLGGVTVCQQGAWSKRSNFGYKGKG